jgi:hypothetical protein
MGSPLRSRHAISAVLKYGIVQIHTANMVSDAEQLATWRTIGARYSEQVLDLAPKVLRSGGLGEQGKLPYTDVCGEADNQNGE